VKLVGALVEVPGFLTGVERVEGAAAAAGGAPDAAAGAEAGGFVVAGWGVADGLGAVLVGVAGSGRGVGPLSVSTGSHSGSGELEDLPPPLLAGAACDCGWLDCVRTGCEGAVVGVAGTAGALLRWPVAIAVAVAAMLGRGVGVAAAGC
jgi:hypothetical protein